MLQMILPLLQQIVIMFIFSILGYLMFRTGKMTMEGNKSIANILVYLSLPAVIINGFLVERTPEKMQALLISAAMTALILAIAVIVSALIFPKDQIAKFAATFSNPGFFGVSIITAVLGNEFVFYAAAYVAIMNVLQWSYGVSLLKKDGSGQKKASGQSAGAFIISVLKAPFMIAIYIGLFFFLTGIPAPGIAKKTLGFVASMNTPLAMIAIGVYLAQTDLLKMLQKKKLYLITAVRQLIIPLLQIFALLLVPAQFADMRLPLLMVAAAPVGTNIAIYAQLHGSDYAYAVETIIISTLLSILTMPVIIVLAQMIW